MKECKKLLTRLGFAIIAAAVFLVAVGADIWSYGEIDETRVADCAIVLGAAAYPDGVSPVYAERLNHSAILYNEGFVSYIIVTGGVGDGMEKSDAQHAREYLISIGVPEVAIICEDKSRITEENLLNAKTIMDGCGFSDALIVSDPLHQRRAMLMAGDCGIEAYSSPTKTSRYKTLSTQLPFLAREEFFYIGYIILRPFR